MKAVIYLDVPEWQIGKPVSVFFPDTMRKTGTCELHEPIAPETEDAIYDRGAWHYVCGACKKPIDHFDGYCRHCGIPVKPLL